MINSSQTEHRLMTSEVIIRYNRILTSPDNLIFETLSKFVNATVIILIDNGVTEIPSNAFKNIVGKQDKLETLFLGGGALRKLGNNAFSQLKSLTELEITSTSIEFISEYAFEFNEVSDKILYIHLQDNKLLNSSGFAEYSFTKLKRPTTIQLDNNINVNFDNHFPCLDQKIFEPFLRSNVKNKIELYYGSLDCSDCRNYWLQRKPDLLKQVLNSVCSNKKDLNDTANFQKCGIK